MKLYTKRIDGKTIIKRASQIIIIKDDLQTINPSEDAILADGWEEYANPVVEYTEAQLLAQAKENKVQEITNHDSSSEVNVFRLNGMDMWLDKATRTGLMLRLQAEAAMGKTATTLWYEGMEVALPTDSAMGLLYALEVYASECYDNTQRHLSEVSKLTDRESVEEYDYRQGYPEILDFEL